MRHLKVLVVLVLILGFAYCLPAQTGLTSLRGTVTDPAGPSCPQPKRSSRITRLDSAQLLRPTRMELMNFRRFLPAGTLSL